MRRQIFILFRLADPGTIQLIKSGTTLITAVVMIIALGTKIVGNQWIAICMQVCYNPRVACLQVLTKVGLWYSHHTVQSCRGCNLPNLHIRLTSLPHDDERSVERLQSDPVQE